LNGPRIAFAGPLVSSVPSWGACGKKSREQK
jgi:hypothetical protein